MSSLCDMALETSDNQTLLVTGLPNDFTAEYGKEIFGQYAKVKDVTTFRMPSGTPENATAAFVAVRADDAEWMLQNLDGNIPNHLQKPVTLVMVRAGSGCHITGPSQIQALTWPLARQRKDVIGIAATGSGKTLAFLLPAFCNMLQTGHNARIDGPGLLVLCPTRELALQTEAQAELFVGFKAVAMYGGGPRHNQLEKYKNGVHTVVACPQRLVEFLGGKHPQDKLDGVSCLVLDEADRMLDMGFGQPIHKIGCMMPKRQHTMLFTATYPMKVQLLGAQLLKPNKVMIGSNKEHEMEEVPTGCKADDRDDDWGPWCATGKKELGIMGPEKRRMREDEGLPKEGLEGGLLDLGSSHNLHWSLQEPLKAEISVPDATPLAERNIEEVEGPPDLASVGAELRSDVTNVEVIADEVHLTESEPEEVEDGLAVHALPAEVDDHPEQADSPTFEEVQQVDGSFSDPIDEETLPGSVSSGILPSQSNPEEVDGSALAPVPVEGGEGSMAQSELEEAGEFTATVSTTMTDIASSEVASLASEAQAEADVQDRQDSPAAMVHDCLAAARKATEGDGATRKRRLRSKTPASDFYGRPAADAAAAPLKRYRIRGKTPAELFVYGVQMSEAENRKKRSFSPSTHATMVSSKCVKVSHSPDRTPRSPAPRSLPLMRGTKSPASSLLPCSAPSTPQRRSKPTSKVPAGRKVKSGTSKRSPRSKHKETLRARERR